MNAECERLEQKRNEEAELEGEPVEVEEVKNQISFECSYLLYDP